MYYIDDSRAVYRDVANLLRCHGIDLDHNRFLILQGEVEQIALMKPKAPSEHEDGFLEYLEVSFACFVLFFKLSFYYDCFAYIKKTILICILNTRISLVLVVSKNR